MKTKLIITFLSIFLIQFISSCCKSSKYYDYGEMTAELSNTSLSADEDLKINLVPVDLEYVSFNSSDFGFSSALAVNCDDGWGGMKHPFKKIEIVSSSQFSDDFDVGENLVSFFLLRRFVGDGEFEYIKFEELNGEEFSGTIIELILEGRPTTDLTHEFKIKLTKSNDEEIVVNLEEVTWI